MRSMIWVSVLLALPAVVANHDAGCAPEQADPATINRVELPDGTVLYIEERGAPLAVPPPIPLSGFLLGEGTWMYMEGNDVDGLQRGGLAFWVPDEMCQCVGADPINDHHCGHGPDTLLY